MKSNKSHGITFFLPGTINHNTPKNPKTIHPFNSKELLQAEGLKNEPCFEITSPSKKDDAPAIITTFKALKFLLRFCSEMNINVKLVFPLVLQKDVILKELSLMKNSEQLIDDLNENWEEYASFMDSYFYGDRVKI